MSHTSQNKKDKWIPWYFVAFFAVIAIVDGIFVTVATRTHTGVVTEHAYEKGLHYNDIIKQSEKQAHLGWQEEVIFDNTTHILTYRIRDKNNTPLANAEVTAHAISPTHHNYDFSTILQPQAEGHYSNSLTFPVKGKWKLHIGVLWNGIQYQTTQQLIVK